MLSTTRRSRRAASAATRRLARPARSPCLAARRPAARRSRTSARSEFGAWRAVRRRPGDQLARGFDTNGRSYTARHAPPRDIVNLAAGPLVQLFLAARELVRELRIRRPAAREVVVLIAHHVNRQITKRLEEPWAGTHVRKRLRFIRQRIVRVE